MILRLVDIRHRRFVICFVHFMTKNRTDHNVYMKRKRVQFNYSKRESKENEKFKYIMEHEQTYHFA